MRDGESFNPLDRGNLYQMRFGRIPQIKELCMMMFQSPRSGKFVSDIAKFFIYSTSL